MAVSNITSLLAVVLSFMLSHGVVICGFLIFFCRLSKMSVCFEIGTEIESFESLA